MASANSRAKRPVITMRISEEAMAALKKRTSPGVKVATLAERYMQAGMEADGVDLPALRLEAKAARRVVVKVMEAVGQAANDALKRFLKEYDEDD